MSDPLGTAIGIGGSLLSSSKGRKGASRSGGSGIPNLSVPGLGNLISVGGGFQIIPDANLSKSVTQTAGLRETQGDLFGALDIEGREEEELARLRELQAPEEARARESLRSTVANRGRLGVGVGGGRTGAFFNPEIAAQEEALARADLERVGASQGFARADEQRLLGNFLSLLNAEIAGRQATLPIAAAAAGLQTAGNPAFAQAANRDRDIIDTLFGGLASTIGGGGGGGLFGDIFGGGATGRTDTPGGFTGDPGGFGDFRESGNFFRGFSNLFTR